MSVYLKFLSCIMFMENAAADHYDNSDCYDDENKVYVERPEKGCSYDYTLER